MAGPADAIAAAAYTPEEQAAVEYADAYFGAQAKLEASKLLVGIGVLDEAGAVLNGLSRHVEGMDFTEKREVAEHFRRLTELCGVTASATIVHLEPVHDESIEQAQPGDGSAAEELEDELPPVEPYKFRAFEKRFLIDTFGEHNTELVAGLSYEQFEYLMRELGDHYETLKIPRLSAAAKQERRRLTEAFILRRQKSEEIAEQIGLKPQAISNGARKMIESIRKRTDQQVLDEMLQEAVRFRPIPEPVDDSEEKPNEPTS